MKMVLAILAVVVIVTILTWGQTNDIIIPQLSIGQETFTNAIIRKINPAEAVIEYHGGGKKIAITNLPAAAIQSLSYDPKAAEAFLQERAKKDAAFWKNRSDTLAAQKAAQDAAVKAAADKKKAADEAAAKRHQQWLEEDRMLRHQQSIEYPNVSENQHNGAKQ